MSAPLYTAQATATGGRVGRARTSDGALDVALVVPTELGGEEADGTNPEQLFAAGYAACFLSAVKLIASKRGVDAETATVTADVALHSEGRGFKLAAALRVAMPGVDPADARKLVDTAHQVCPYSNATRDNIDVELVLEEPAAA